MEPNELHISNVKVFDSVDGRITGPVDVTVRGPVIASITPAGAAALSGPAIDGTGKTLLPGLIDAHWHAMFTTIPAALAQVSEFGYVVARAVVSARETLLRGFTTVRDLGGPVFGVKQAIDEGSIPARGSTRRAASFPSRAGTGISGCPTRCRVGCAAT
ncbi:amidohydrolase family protein [Mycobacterium ulcerans str. Harvey]|uniref:Amidohydrolase family protein n=1 Tax=Mycobacterium ulcerans str. Harvey TaxID=1299332 RepID=A0ABN0R5A7_MYCUL|nr:amidohydrolase family protein [Mycobacterium ulcerans str. Harvey]